MMSPVGKPTIKIEREKEPMRPGQQNRRPRNRNNNNNNNRKGPNPLSRNYESNGPDVKIRGNAQHIADKYSQLARDATASGDRVMAENYLQHAEHYYRIIAAANPGQQIQQRDQNDDDGDDDNSGDDDDNNNDTEDNAASDNSRGDGRQDDQGRGEVRRNEGRRDNNRRDNNRRDDGRQEDGRRHNAPAVAQGADGPQPVIEGTPAEVAFEESQFNQANDASGRDEAKVKRPRTRRRKPDTAVSDGGSDAGNVTPEASADKPREQSAELFAAPEKTPEAAE
jgi:hypothetical protein